VKSKNPAIAISFFVIALSVAWLLNIMGVIPGRIWLWSGGLGVLGILLLAFSRFDRFSFVIGSSLIVSSVLCVLRETGKLELNLDAPVLFLTVGLLSLFAQILPSAPESEGTFTPSDSTPSDSTPSDSTHFGDETK